LGSAAEEPSNRRHKRLHADKDKNNLYVIPTTAGRPVLNEVKEQSSEAPCRLDFSVAGFFKMTGRKVIDRQLDSPRMPLI